MDTPLSLGGFHRAQETTNFRSWLACLLRAAFIPVVPRPELFAHCDESIPSVQQNCLSIDSSALSLRGDSRLDLLALNYVQSDGRILGSD